MIDVFLRRYSLPSIRHEGWAIVVLGSDGFFSAVSDYGDYAFCWGHHGCRDFRDFVIGLARSPDYATTKLCAGRGLREYDGGATVREIRNYILHVRRDRTWPKRRARTEWDLIEHWAGDVESHEVGFSGWCERTGIDEASEYPRYRPNARCMAFCREVLPRLATVLRDELARERLAGEGAA